MLHVQVHFLQPETRFCRLLYSAFKMILNWFTARILLRFQTLSKTYGCQSQGITDCRLKNASSCVDVLRDGDTLVLSHHPSAASPTFPQGCLGWGTLLHEGTSLTDPPCPGSPEETHKPTDCCYSGWESSKIQILFGNALFYLSLHNNLGDNLKNLVIWS